MNKQTNWRAMQVPPHRAPNKPPAWDRPGDTNVKAMTMGSWHASASNGGARRKRGG